MTEEPPTRPHPPDEVWDDLSDPLGSFGRTVLGLYLVALPIVLCALAVFLWPYTHSDPTSSNPNAVSMSSLASDRIGVQFSMELSLILLVIVTGALGSYVHSAVSFADYVGNRRLASSWTWWYVLRTFIGVSLAVIFYFVVRGGLLSGGAPASDINPFGVAAVSGLVGMFSKQATDKLREVFDTLFRTDRPVARADKLGNPVPHIQNIEPTSATAGGEVVLDITGDHFVPQSIVSFKGVDLPTTFITPTQLRVRLPASMLSEPGVCEVTVFEQAGIARHEGGSITLWSNGTAALAALARARSSISSVMSTP